MTQIVFNTYEIVREIGSGGGGVVFLARHLRLGKLVVLKADKRTLKTKPEALRREVDALKNLSHTYIPQVYDFFVENDTVYTVMDYIEGESLDKPLKRGERFEQADVIRWADQLLQALVYLHGRPPHGILHSDIKPANVMLTPQGDIRLIDFNIALALGEEGAVRVGLSQGYASPEHYGIDYSGFKTAGMGTSSSVPPATAGQAGTTALLDGQAGTTEVLTDQMGSGQAPGRGPTGQPDPGGSFSSSKRSVLLDVRSDIYSLGATLYHLFTGVRPDKDADKVTPISEFGVSPAVARIIERSMALDPGDRYQTAQDMLDDLRAIHDRDPRAVRHKKRMKVTAVALVCAFLVGGVMTFVGQRGLREEEERARIAEEQAKLEAQKAEEEERTRREAEEQAKLEAQRAEEEERARREAEEKAKRALELVNSSGNALSGGDRPGAIESALEALELDTQYNGQAQLALTEALGVYELSPGFSASLRTELAEQPSKLALTRDGGRLGVLSGGFATVFDTSSGQVLASLPATGSVLGDLVFSGSDTLIYAGAEGIRCYDLAGMTEKWTGGPATAIALSEDGATVAAIYRDEPVVNIYSVADGSLRMSVDLANGRSVPANDVYVDPGNELLALSADGNMLAVSAAGDLAIYDLGDRSRDITIYEDSNFTRFEGGFYGKYLAFSASSGEANVFAVIDARKAAQTGGFSSRNPFHVRADGTGIYLSNQNILVSIDPETGNQREVAYTEKYIDRFSVSGGYAAVVTEDGLLSFYGPEADLLNSLEETGADDLLDLKSGVAAAAGHDTAWVRLFAFDGETDQAIFNYPADLPHTEARLSADGSTVMLFRYDSFTLYSAAGEQIASVQLPEPGEVYDQQYRRDEKGSYLEVFYNDGRVLAYSAVDGSLTEERAGEPHDGTLDQEFVTSRFRVEAPLHGEAVFYDLDSGEERFRLNEDAYVAYVYESGEYVIADMLETNGGRYGLLFDSNFQLLARLPGLCDVPGDGTAIFDDQTGTLRRSRIFSVEELKTMANQSIKEEKTR